MLQSILDNLNSIVIEPIGGSFSITTYAITPGSIIANGQLSLSAPLVELIAAEPCDDAIVTEIIHSGAVELPGQWVVTIPIIGDVSGDFLVSASGFTAEVLVSLLNPDISGAVTPTDFDRAVGSVTLTDFQATGLEFSATGFQGLGDDLIAALVPILQGQILAILHDILSISVDNAVGLLQPVLVAIPPPVTIQVIP